MDYSQTHHKNGSENLKKLISSLSGNILEKPILNIKPNDLLFDIF